MSAYARQGYHYNRNRLSQSSTTRDAESGSLLSVGGGASRSSVKNGQQRNPHHAGGIQRFSRQNRMALSQNGEQGGQEIMVDNAGGEFSLSQETEITLTQALLEPDKKQMQRSRASSGATKNNDERSIMTTNRHLAGRTPRAVGGRGGMNSGRALQHHASSTPSNRKRQQMQQQQQKNIQLSQKKNRRMNPNQPQRTVAENSYRNFTTPVAGTLSSSRSVVSSRNHGVLSQSMHDEDDTSTIQSRSLLTQDSQVGGSSRVGGTQQQHHRYSMNNLNSTLSTPHNNGLQQQQQRYSTKRSTMSTPHNNGLQQQQQRSTISTTSNNTANQRIPSLPTSRRPVSTAVRTLGGISTTLATLTTPVKAFRSMTSFAVRTAARTGATLGLTPCNFRSRSGRLTAVPASGGGGVRPSLSKAAVVGTNGVLLKRTEEQTVDDDDDASKVTQKTYDPAEEKDVAASSSLVTRDEAAPSKDEKEKVDDLLSKLQTAMDDKMKQFDEKLSQKFTQKEQELKEFVERTSKTLDEKLGREFTEKKQELEELVERTSRTLKEGVSKIEGIQVAMDAFPTKVASITKEHEAQIRQLVGQSRKEIEKESKLVVESISSNARAVADDEAKRSISEVGNNIAAAKGDFQVWMDGVLAGMRSNVIGHRRPVMDASGDENIAGTNGHVGTSSEKENEQPDIEEISSSRDDANDTETASSDVSSHKFGDKWGVDEDATEKEEVAKTSATPFSSKTTPSTAATPFSRKTTPLKNNYGKNRKSIQLCREANEDEMKSEMQQRQKLQNESGVLMSPSSKHVSSSTKKSANRRPPSSPQISLKLSSSRKTRGGVSPLSPRVQNNNKVKSAKKAPKRESKHKMKTKSPMKQTAPRFSQASKDKSTQSSEVKAQQNNSDNLPTKLTVETKSSTKTGTAPQLSQPSEKSSGRSKKSDSVPQLSQRSDKKRDQSALNVEKSTRRSKRVKESSRAEKAAAALKARTEQAALRTQRKKAKASKAKQVTPLDGAQGQSKAKKKYPSLNDEDDEDVELHKYPTNDDPLDLLGKSIVVTQKSGEELDSSGLDSDEGLVENTKTKLFTPFQRGKKTKKSYGGRKKKTAVAINGVKSKPQKAESVWSFKW